MSFTTVANFTYIFVLSDSFPIFHTHTHTHTHFKVVFIYSQTHTHTHTHTHIYIYIYICVCVCVCVCEYINTTYCLSHTSWIELPWKRMNIELYSWNWRMRLIQGPLKYVFNWFNIIYKYIYIWSHAHSTDFPDSFPSHPSLSFIAPNRPFNLHSVSAQSWWKFSLFGQQWYVHVKGSTEERHLWGSRCFSSNGPHALFVLLW